MSSSDSAKVFTNVQGVFNACLDGQAFLRPKLVSKLKINILVDTACGVASLYVHFVSNTITSCAAASNKYTSLIYERFQIHPRFVVKGWIPNKPSHHLPLAPKSIHQHTHATQHRHASWTHQSHNIKARPHNRYPPMFSVLINWLVYSKVL